MPSSALWSLPLRSLGRLNMPTYKMFLALSSLFPLSSEQEPDLSLVSLSFLPLLQHHCQTPRPYPRPRNLHTSLPGLSNALPTHASTAPKSAVR